MIPGQGEFGLLHPGWGRENRKTFFAVYVFLCLYDIGVQGSLLPALAP